MAARALVLALVFLGCKREEDAPTAPPATEADAEAAGPPDAAPDAEAGAPVEADGPEAAADASAEGTDAPAEGPSISAAWLYGLQLGARWTYRRSGGFVQPRAIRSSMLPGGNLRWKEITACERVPLLDESARPLAPRWAYVRENRSVTGTTSVHYLVQDELGVRRIRRDDIDLGSLTMTAIYSPPSPRLLEGPYPLGHRWEFALRTAEFEWPRNANPRVVTFRGANQTSAVDVVSSLEPRVVVAGTFPTVGVDRQWAANNAHNVQSYYAPGIGEVVEVTVWPATPLPIIQVEELVSFTPGYGSCDGSPLENAAPCDPPLLVCDRPWGADRRGCTDPRVDPENCGACGTLCPGGVCAGGVCQRSQCSLSCAGSTVCCPNAWGWASPGCTNPGRDRWNCGGCGAICAPGRVCDRGVCACAPGTRDCGRGCQDVLRDPRNCGACGNVCGGDTPRCDMGICYGACRALDLVECAGRCVDLDWDDDHCGACGRKCGPGTGTLQCRLGECVPCEKAGYADCGGSCADLAWSREHCGACGNECPRGQVCVFGKCTGGDGSCRNAICTDPDKICCNGDCVNPRTSDRHCGGCGVAVCRGGCTEACRQGICSLVDCGGGDD